MRAQSQKVRQAVLVTGDPNTLPEKSTIGQIWPR